MTRQWFGPELGQSILASGGGASIWQSAKKLASKWNLAPRWNSGLQMFCVVPLLVPGQMPAVETGHMSAVETGQMSAVETGQMSAVETRQMS